MHATVAPGRSDESDWREIIWLKAVPYWRVWARSIAEVLFQTCADKYGGIR